MATDLKPSTTYYYVVGSAPDLLCATDSSLASSSLCALLMVTATHRGDRVMLATGFAVLNLRNAVRTQTLALISDCRERGTIALSFGLHCIRTILHAQVCGAQLHDAAGCRDQNFLCASRTAHILSDASPVTMHSHHHLHATASVCNACWPSYPH